VIRVAGEARESLPAVADAVRAVDPGIALLGPRPMEEVVVTTIGRERLVTMLLTLFGLVGLGLGAVGVYGVASQSVSERRCEIGIRLALGAEGRGVMSSTIASGMAPVLVGAGAGLVVAFGVGSLLRGVLYGVAEHDPVTLAAAPVVLALVALGALTVPAVRAARLDPVRTLNAE
jgi:ABC-type antimicrobial peptide transport system permease subunit